MTNNEAIEQLKSILETGVADADVLLYTEDYEAIDYAIQALEQEPKVGEWLEKEVVDDKVIKEWQSARCSVCDRYHTTPYMYYFDNYKFCPHCGCRMKGDEET